MIELWSTQGDDWLVQLQSRIINDASDYCCCQVLQKACPTFPNLRKLCFLSVYTQDQDQSLDSLPIVLQFHVSQVPICSTGTSTPFVFGANVRCVPNDTTDCKLHGERRKKPSNDLPFSSRSHYM